MKANEELRNAVPSMTILPETFVSGERTATAKEMKHTIFPVLDHQDSRIRPPKGESCRDNSTHRA